MKAKVVEITDGRGVDAVLDTVGRESATNWLDLIAYGGHLAHISGASDYTPIKSFTKVISYHEDA